MAPGGRSGCRAAETAHASAVQNRDLLIERHLIEKEFRSPIRRKGFVRPEAGDRRRLVSAAAAATARPLRRGRLSRPGLPLGPGGQKGENHYAEKTINLIRVLLIWLKPPNKSPVHASVTPRRILALAGVFRCGQRGIYCNGIGFPFAAGNCTPSSLAIVGAMSMLATRSSFVPASRRSRWR